MSTEVGASLPAAHKIGLFRSGLGTGHLADVGGAIDERR